MKQWTFRQLGLVAASVFIVAAGVLVLTAESQGHKVVPDNARPPVDQPVTIDEEVVIMPGRVIAPPEVKHPIEMKDYHVSVSVKDNVATTSIEQVFVNTSQRTLEAKYIYPLPEDANFSSFTLTINGKAVEGKILEKEKARKAYTEIVRKLIDPGLLEFIDRKTVQASIAPIFAGEKKTVQLSYSQILTQDGGFYKYQYPYGLKAGNKLPIEDASIKVTVKTDQPLKTVYSPSHSPDVDRSGKHKATMAMDLGDSKTFMDKPFIVYFSQDNKAISMSSLAYKKRSDKNGYFLLTLRTPDELNDSDVLPKDVVVVIDTSGSMSGKKIEQAKEALSYIVNHLQPDDRFNIVAFNSDTSTFRQDLVNNTSRIKSEALDYIDDLTASGGTNIEEALTVAFDHFESSASNRPDYVIFLTDGQPTVGMTDIKGLIALAEKDNDGDAKLFNFGVGYNVNTELLGKLGSDNHGSTTYVEPDENLELALTGFYNKIERPVLSNVDLDFKNIQVDKVYPKKLGDLFSGSEIVLMGRFKHEANGKVVLTGKVGDKTKTYSYTVDWGNGKQTANNFLPRLWAGRRIGYLLDSIHQNGENPELKEEIIDLSKEYGIITPYTSFLAMEPEYEQDDVVPGEGSSVRRNRADKEEKRLSGGYAPAAAPMADMASYKTKVGRNAVKLQKSLQNMQAQASLDQMEEAQVASGVAPPSVKAVGDKTFMRIKGVWTDTAYDKKTHGAPKTVTFGSSQYFDLLKKKPELAQYFSLGKEVLVLVNGRAYQVTAPKTG